MGSLKSPCRTSYRSSVETTAPNCLVFEKIAFFAFWRQTDRQTNEQMDSIDALSRSRCREPASGILIKDCTRRFVLLTLTTDRHEASRGLFATVELLVVRHSVVSSPHGVYRRHE